MFACDLNSVWSSNDHVKLVISIIKFDTFNSQKNSKENKTNELKTVFFNAIISRNCIYKKTRIR